MGSYKSADVQQVFIDDSKYEEVVTKKLINPVILG